MAEHDKQNSDIFNAISHLHNAWGQINPEVAIICGSGWGELSEIFENSLSLNYSDIPGFSSTTVEGHEGILRLCEINQRQILLFQGRRHLYEGVGWEPIRFPVLLAHELGVKNLLLTNAAGGINPTFKVGDLMVLEDHLNFMGTNPLIGPVPTPNIPRFPDQTEVYDIKLRQRLQKVAKANNLDLVQGIYLALSGPAFETPAEIRAFRVLGADAVGMSTIPEAMLGHALGMKVLAVSCISNLAAGISKEKLTHQDVKQAAQIALPRMKTFFSTFLQDLLD
jgi:purine-nucleoside phosphorylase